MDNQNNTECSEIRLWLVDHSHGRSGRWRGRIDRHLSGCGECREWAGFIRAVEDEYLANEPGARLGFENRLEIVAGEAESRVVPGRFQRRFITRFIAATVVGITLAGGFLPTVRESLVWLGNLQLVELAIAGLGASVILILSSPLLFHISRNRIEES